MMGSFFVPSSKSTCCTLLWIGIVAFACYISCRTIQQKLYHSSNFGYLLRNDTVQQTYYTHQIDKYDNNRNVTIYVKHNIRRSVEAKHNGKNIPINMFRNEKKQQQSQNEYVFYTIKAGRNGLGESNPDSAVNNPLKGLVGKPRSNGIDTTIRSTLDYYDIGIDEVMFRNPKAVTTPDTVPFDWTVTDAILADSANRNKHVIWRFIAQDNDKTLRIPSYLLDSGMNIVRYNVTDTISGLITEEISLKYDDPILIDAFDSFIAALGKRYNNDARLAFLQMGLIGLGGEGYIDELAPDSIIPNEILEQITMWYESAFPNTKLQAWYSFPRKQPISNNGIGYTDNSFAYSTLDGIYNGFINDTTFFWPTIVANKQEQFWHTGVMGGKTQKDIQYIVFQNDYPAFTENHQDFSLCVDMSHASYIVHEPAFTSDTSLSGSELLVALSNHARMGYNFYVSAITLLLDMSVAMKERDTINIDIYIKQSGVAPFYYPLNIVLTCTGMKKPIVVFGVEELVKPSDEQPFRFNNVSATESCLQSIQIYLESPYLYPQQRIKLAQEFINESTGGIDVYLPTPTNSDWDKAMNGVILGLTLMKVKDNKTVPIYSILNKDTIDLLDVGKHLSIRCDVNETRTSTTKNSIATTINHIMFRWGGSWKRITTGSPWALNDHDNGHFIPVRYFANTGSKTVSAKAYNKNNQLIGFYTVNFTIVDTTLPETTSPSTTPIVSSPTTTYPIQRPLMKPRSIPMISPKRTPTNVPATSPIRTIVPMVQPTQSSDTDIIFKKFTLVNTDNMFDFPYSEITQGGYISIDPVDKQFTIVCSTSSNVDSVMFHWNGQSHYETNPLSSSSSLSSLSSLSKQSSQSWSLNGQTKNLYNPVPYLRTMGKKIIMVAAMKDGKVIATKTITFTFIPTIKPPSQGTK